MYYEALFQRLNRYRVKYLVCGGLAVNLLGAPRYTKDTDLLIRMKKKAKREQDLSDIRVLRRLFKRENKNKEIKRSS